MSDRNPYTPPEANVELPAPARPAVVSTVIPRFFALLILMQSLAWLIHVPDLYRLVSSGAVSVLASLCAVLAFALLLLAGVRFFLRKQPPKFVFAGSVVLGYLSLSYMPKFIGAPFITGVLLALVIGIANFIRSKKLKLRVSDAEA